MGEASRKYETPKNNHVWRTPQDYYHYYLVTWVLFSIQHDLPNVLRNKKSFGPAKTNLRFIPGTFDFRYPSIYNESLTTREKGAEGMAGTTSQLNIFTAGSNHPH